MNKSFKKMLTLICREYWEHKIIMLWLPLGATLLTLVLQFSASFSDGNLSINYTSHSHSESEAHSETHHKQFTGISALMYLLFKQEPGADTITSFNNYLLAFGSLMAILLFFSLLIYTHSCFYADRQRKEILFWRSMPVSELQNLFSKLLVVCIIMPTIYALMLLIYGLGNLLRFPEWENVLQILVRLTNLSLISILFTVIFLPIISWIFVCSAAARRSPIFLSLLLPLAVGLVLRIALGQNYLSSGVKGYFSDVWANVKFGPETLRQQLDFLWSVEFLPGLLVSVVLLAACVWLRNNRYEV